LSGWLNRALGSVGTSRPMPVTRGGWPLGHGASKGLDCRISEPRERSQVDS
jgi:hypothetical protein